MSTMTDEVPIRTRRYVFSTIYDKTHLERPVSVTRVLFTTMCPSMSSSRKLGRVEDGRGWGWGARMIGTFGNCSSKRCTPVQSFYNFILAPSLVFALCFETNVLSINKCDILIAFLTLFHETVFVCPSNKNSKGHHLDHFFSQLVFWVFVRSIQYARHCKTLCELD